MNSTSLDLSDQPRANSRSSLSATDIRHFARLHRLKLRLDECGDPIIPGRHGAIGEYSAGRFCACFHGVGAEPFSRLRAHRIRQALQHSIGHRITGTVGADEALFAFGPLDERVATWFVHALGIKRRRAVSLETAARLAQFSRSRRTIAGEVFHGAGATAECSTNPSPPATRVNPAVPSRSVG